MTAKTSVFVYFCLILCLTHEILFWMHAFKPKKTPQKIHWSLALIFFDPKLICQIDETKVFSHEVTSPGHIFPNILRNIRVLTGSLWTRFVLNLIYLISVLVDAIFCATIRRHVLHPILQIFQFQLLRLSEEKVSYVHHKRRTGNLLYAWLISIIICCSNKSIKMVYYW